MRRWLASTLLIGSALVSAVPAPAQTRSRTGGFQLSLHGSGTTVQVPDQERESGRGYGGGIGYGHARLLLYVDADIARLEAPYVGEISVLHGDAGVRFHFRSERAALIPYITAAYTRRIGKRDDFVVFGTSHDVEVRGGGLTLGGGALYYLLPSVAAHAAVRLTGGAMDEFRINGETLRGCLIIICEGNSFFEGSGRLALGLAWVPGLLQQ